MNNKRFLKALGLIIVVALLAAALPLQAKAQEGETLCVNTDGTGGCYTSIQAAVNAASDGDTVIVTEGAYNVWCPTTDPNNYTGRNHNLFIGKNILDSSIKCNSDFLRIP